MFGENICYPIWKRKNSLANHKRMGHRFFGVASYNVCSNHPSILDGGDTHAQLRRGLLHNLKVVYNNNNNFRCTTRTIITDKVAWICVLFTRGTKTLVCIAGSPTFITGHRNACSAGSWKTICSYWLPCERGRGTCIDVFTTSLETRTSCSLRSIRFLGNYTNVFRMY